MNVATVRRALSDRTSAVIPVHLFGNPAPMEELMELAAARGIRVLEDAAQAAGARLGPRFAGALGHAATFSFFPSKNLPGTGDGGAITTDDDDVAATARRLRFHGSEDKLTHTEVGYNSRLDELQAAGLRVALGELAAWTQSRRQAAAAYSAAGLGEVVQLPLEAEAAQSCFHLYVVRSSERDRILAALSTAGIGSRSYYTTPVHRQPAMAAYAAATELGDTDRFAAENLALPMGPGLDEDAVATVVATVREALTA